MRLLFGLLLAVTSLPAWAITTEEVSYKEGKESFKGFLALPDTKGPRPAVIIVHEWWGHNEYVRNRAKQLAEMGYTAFALDMYGDGKTAGHPKQAGEFAGKVNSDMPRAKRRFEAAMNIVKQQPGVEGNIAAIGYCFGGGVVLNMARMGIPLKGVVSFHGSLASTIQAKPGQTKAKVLVLNGADDPFVKKEHIAAFKKEMQDAKVDFQFIDYDGAVHAFTNPGATALGKKFKLPLAYDKDADKKSWAKMKDFLASAFAN